MSKSTYTYQIIHAKTRQPIYYGGKVVICNAENPVKFISNINRRRMGGELRLPSSKTIWHYCRAGTWDIKKLPVVPNNPQQLTFDL